MRFPKGVSAWVPVVGMVIRYRKDIRSSNPTKRDPDMVATVREVFPDESLRIERDRGVKRKTRLLPATWAGDWEPVPVVADIVPQQLAIPSGLSEQDVRRIVREELARAFSVKP